MGPRSLDPVLARQLKRLGIASESDPPSAEAWARLLATINEHYQHMNDDRALLTRSVDLSNNEIEQWRHQVDLERATVQELVSNVSSTLAEFGQLVRDEALTGGIESSKRELAIKLGALLDRQRAGIPEHTSELSIVRGHMIRLAEDLTRLMTEMAEQTSARKEIEVARAVQQLLVPGENELDREGLVIAGHFQPAAECGGDWWSVADVGGDRTLLVLGDVTGHGIASAIFTGAAKAACELSRQLTGAAITADELLRHMNLALFETAKRRVLMTCVAAIIDPRAMTVTSANAGHHFPILLRGGVVHPLVVEGPPLGAAADSRYRTETTPVRSGDLLVWTTDGVVEAENPDGEQFTERRLRAVSLRAASGGAIAVRDAIIEALATFRGPDLPLGDDITIVVTYVK
jgi:sigma-B regulation protein RsbU (phosphoserine phosphatase)